MQVVSYPAGFVASLLDKFKEILNRGTVAEGRYFGQELHGFTPGRLAVPVSSGGAALFCLLAYQKYINAKRRVVIQSNTMRALYTIPKLLGMQLEVAESGYDDFLAMKPDSLKVLLAKCDKPEEVVVVYSVIGGFLAGGYGAIEEICRDNDIPLIVDAAHAHYLAGIQNSGYSDLAYSFYATKILPGGEGGLVATGSQAVYDWVKRFLMYDRFHNELEIGLNLRASELSACFIHTLMTDPGLRKYFVEDRIAIARRYREICAAYDIHFLDFTAAEEYNGYKFIVLDPYEKVAARRTDLTKYPPTSAVFDTDVRGPKTSLPHWCPPTYSSLYHQFY